MLAAAAILASSPVFAEGVTFDGTNDYLLRAAGIGASNAYFFTSFWIRTTTTNQSVLLGNDDGQLMTLTTSGTIQFTADNSSGTTIFTKTTSSSVNDGEWHHVTFRYNATNADYDCYIDNAVVSLIGVANSTGVLDYSGSNMAVGADSSGGQKFNGALAEFMFGTLDVDITDNNVRRILIRGNRPGNVGSDGSEIGYQPEIYFSRRKDEAVSAFNTNRGTGGSFSLTGTLTDPGVQVRVGA